MLPSTAPRLALLLGWMALSAAADGPRLTPGEHAITIDGAKVHLYAPRTIRGKRPHPVLVFLHGAGGRADLHRGWIRAHLAGRRWLVACPQGPNRPTTHDALAIGRYRALIETLAKRASIDRRRVYLSGHSDGCTFGFYLLGELPGVFCAFAGLNGMYLGADEARLKAAQIPIGFSVGTKDMYSSRFDGAVARLRVLGLPVETHRPPLGHDLDPATFKRMCAWLAKQKRPKEATPPADRVIDRPLPAKATFVERADYAAQLLARAYVLVRAMRGRDARTLLKRIVDEHPRSDAAAPARDLLSRMHGG